jgi:hypothetical protein
MLERQGKKSLCAWTALIGIRNTGVKNGKNWKDKVVASADGRLIR